jgi:radical SAM superfamily enzyme with C-terminal helix-hairpin-helix motif
LQTKYEALVTALQDRVKAEQEARMRRALEDVERSARIEAERSRLSFEIQQQAEAALSLKFKSMISELQKEWESEEAKRAQQLEEKLRAHYGAMIDHMEAQLQMALRIQDEADKQWMDDVEARNKQQIGKEYVKLYVLYIRMFIIEILAQRSCKRLKKSVGGYMTHGSLTISRRRMSSSIVMRTSSWRREVS